MSTKTKMKIKQSMNLHLDVDQTDSEDSADAGLGQKDGSQAANRSCARSAQEECDEAYQDSREDEEDAWNDECAKDDEGFRDDEEDVWDDEEDSWDDEGSAVEESAAEKPKGVQNKELGARGEEAAAKYLERNGYQIIARNWTCAFGEADIIAYDEDALVFVEVKTRQDYSKGLPEEAVTAKKRMKYERIACSFLSDFDSGDIAVRFDVIGIFVIGPDRALLKHHINAFGAA